MTPNVPPFAHQIDVMNGFDVAGGRIRALRRSVPRASWRSAPIAGRTSLRGESGRLGLVLALVTLCALLIAVAAGVFGIPGVPSLTSDDVATTSVAPRQLTVAQLSTLDPQGLPPSENDGLLDELVDGDLETGWRTDRYATRDFGELKDGLGIVVDMGTEVTLTSLTLGTPSEGISYDVRVADANYDDPSQWQTVHEERGSSAASVIAFDEPIETRHLLLWVIAPLMRYDGGWRAAFSEVSIEGVRV